MPTKTIYNFIIILSIVSLVLPAFSFAQIKVPETPEEIGDLLFRIMRPFLEGVNKAWQEALGIWQKMLDFLKNIWNLQVKPSFQNIWEKVFSLFKKGK